MSIPTKEITAQTDATLAEQINSAFSQFESASKQNLGATSKISYLPHIKQILALTSLQLQASNVEQFKEGLDSLSKVAAAYIEKKEFVLAACVARFMEESWKATDGAVRESQRSHFETKLERLAQQIFYQGRHNLAATEEQTLCAQLCLQIALDPGRALEKVLLPAKDPVSWTYREARLHDTMQDPAITEELHFGCDRLAVAAAFRSFEHDVRQRCGVNKIARALIENALDGDLTRPSIYSGDTIESHKKAVKLLALGLYQLIRNPAVHETTPTCFADAKEQIHAVSFVARLLDASFDWGVHQHDRRHQQSFNQLDLTILPPTDIQCLNPRISAAAQASWLQKRYQDASQEALEAFRNTCRTYLANTTHKDDSALIKAVGVKIQKDGLSHHRAWTELATGVTSAIADPMFVMKDDHHSSYAVLCILSQLIEKLPGYRSSDRSAHQEPQPVVAENEKVITFQKVANWIKRTAEAAHGKRLDKPRYESDYPSARVLLKDHAASPKAPFSENSLDAVDDMVQALLFFMRDLPNHFKGESGPDAAVADYQICSSLVLHLSGLAVEEEDPHYFCASLQNVRITPTDLKRYASTLHPHLAAEIGGMLAQGALADAALHALTILRKINKTLPRDATQLGSFPEDMRQHYLARLVNGAITYFESELDNREVTPLTCMQTVAIAHQALSVSEPTMADTAMIESTERDVSVTNPVIKLERNDSLRIISLTNEVVRRASPPALDIQSIREKPRTEGRDPIAE
jgi:hypothetical protein